MKNQQITLDDMEEKPSAEELTRNMSEFFSIYQKVLQEYVEKYSGTDHPPFFNPTHATDALWKVWAQFYTNPETLWAHQVQYMSHLNDLTQNVMSRFLGENVAPLYAEHGKDRRFQNTLWNEHIVFDFIKQAYLMTSNWLEDITEEDAAKLDPKTAQKLRFYTKQFIDAMSPSNFAFTNPDVIEETLKSNGENLVRGVQHLLEDVKRSKQISNVSTANPESFEIGKDLAATPGNVVYQNDLMQLIHYAPAGKKAYSRPLLVIPPWINKYYILDMRPENSYIKWVLEQGYDIFLISWVNPDKSLASKNFEDYMDEGPLAALNFIEKHYNHKDVNAIGYCLGGTLLATTLAYMQAKGDERINAATFFTTLLDFSDPGEIGIFINDQTIDDVEEQMSHTGYFSGEQMCAMFSMLRSNEMIWSFVINNYLMGKEPFPFDLLYWNSDSSSLPAAMQSFYLRNMYLENNLIEPGKLTIKGVPINLQNIKTPAYFLSAKDDHIAPWKSTYEGTKLFGGDVQFTLTASGHIAGVINPPVKKKYSFWQHDVIEQKADQWFEKSKESAGSWWEHWHEWNKKHAGNLKNITAKDIKDPHVIEAAPGSYVKVRD